MINLPDDWSECERGNTLLVNTDGDTPKWVAYVDLPGGRVMEIALSPENYPSLEVMILSQENQDNLSDHLDALQDQGWYVRKRNHGEYTPANVRLTALAKKRGWDVPALTTAFEMEFVYAEGLTVEQTIDFVLNEHWDVESVREKLMAGPATSAASDD
jgi:hypothetical protein